MYNICFRVRRLGPAAEIVHFTETIWDTTFDGPFCFSRQKNLMEITACTCRNFFGLFFFSNSQHLLLAINSPAPLHVAHSTGWPLMIPADDVSLFSTNNKWKEKRIVSVVHPDVFIFLSLSGYSNKKKGETPSYHDKPPIFATVHSWKCPCCSCVFLRLSSASIPTSPVFLFILIHSARLYIYIHTSSDYITLIK